MSQYINFTEDDLYRASKIDLVAFLEQRGEHLKRVGNTHKLIYSDESGEHDSITVNDSRWYDHRQRKGGGPIQFMQEHYGLCFQDSVLELLGGCVHSEQTSLFKPLPKTKKEFNLPEPNTDMRRTFAYLTKQRYILPEIVSFFANENKIYEEKKHHNAVFVGMNENGVPKQAHQRSTVSFGDTFRMTVEGSDTQYSFSHFGNSNQLYIFEAPIDMLSFLSLNQKNWQQHSYIAMNGVYESAVLKALESNPKLRNVYICTDNDIGGIEAADRLRDILVSKGYHDVFRVLPQNKDFNEDLKALHGIEPQPAVPHRRKEIFNEIIDSAKFIGVAPSRANEMLQVALNRKNYTAAAEIALGTSAVFLSYGRNEKPEDIFDILKKRLQLGYKSYADKIKTKVRFENLNKAVSAAFKNMRNYPNTLEQNSKTAESLFNLAESAAICGADMQMNEDETMSEEPQILIVGQ